jgi:DNA polymerase-3 subunit delta'
VLSDVLGQDAAVSTLRRVLDGKFVSPLLLIGEEGVGRAYSVQQFAQEVFCDGTREQACECTQCFRLREKTHPDLVVVAPQGDKEIGVDQVREALEQTNAFPSMGPLKLFLVDGADRMSVAASNAFLKTLEEPNEFSRFFLVAEKISRVIPTIQSRCGRVNFQKLPENTVVSKLESRESDPIKALVFARMGEGSIGRADRYWRSGKLALRDKVFSLLVAGVQKDLPSIFLTITSLEKENKDLPLGLRFLEHMLHDVIMAQHDPSRMINVDIVEDLKTVSQKMSVASRFKLMHGVRGLIGLHQSVRINLPFHVQNLFVETFISEG